ncbi:MAG: fungal-specific transcription factor domain-containing protein [Benniella sp.]|nr:MAG: fungal-specific transcription factor domain-containing protein [Benniella sp.]
MAVPPQSPFQFQHVPHPGTNGAYQDPSIKPGPIPSELSAGNSSAASGSKKQKTTPPCDRCRQRRIKCDRLEPTCSSCVKYKATCVRTAFPAGAPLSTVSVDAIGGPGLRILTAGKRDRHLTETEILDSCLRDVRALQMNRLRRMEQFFDRLGIDETRLDEVSWLTEQIKLQQESSPGSVDTQYQFEEISEKFGHRASSSWVKQLFPLLQATKRVQQIPSTAHLYPKSLPLAPANNPLQATLTESGQFICPVPKPTPFPVRVPLSVLNKTMFELSVYDCTQYLGPVAGTRAVTWSEEMRFPLPWLVPEPQVQESLLELPPMDQMMDLIEWMVQSPLFIYLPVLSKACILNAIVSAVPIPDGAFEGAERPQSPTVIAGETSALPQRIAGRVSAVFLLNAIMALGAAYRTNAINQGTPHKLLSDPMAREKKYHDFQVFFDRCRALTVYILDQPRVSSLQGLLLLMKCPAIPGIQNLYREQACTMALSLGLHRDPAPWTLCRSVIQLRRNIFWCCFVIDASYSLNSGSPERFPDDYITVGLPEKPSIENGDDVGEIEVENETQRIGFLIEQAKLWRIVKKIRRCGQTSNKSSESYCEGNNLYRSMETGAPSAGSKQSPSPGSAQPPWVWRADSARRILDVELAQWQMELPQNLRFDFALTRQDDPCPFLVRVNGLGAMLQIIFNEVLILLHHPFLILADSQHQQKRGQGMFTPGRHTKPRSNTGPSKNVRSRRSSSTSRPSHLTNVSGGAPLADDVLSKASRSLPPFLNTCTKAAEAITFLIDHLLQTTPEWLVCHNEVESAMHMAERVHALNVTMASNNAAAGTLSNGFSHAAHGNAQQAKCQLKKTRAFRKTIKELDQFTMSTGYRPDLMTKELLAKGSARERLVRCMRQFLLQKRGSDYYRLPRSPPELDSLLNANQMDSVVEAGAGQDHLEMKLAFFDQKVWIRYYNIRIKDGVESRNGAESWLEILNPYVPVPELEVDSEDEDEISAQPVFGFSSADDFLMATFEGEDVFSGDQVMQGIRRRRMDSSGDLGDSTDGGEEPMDPPQSSSTAFIEFFSNPNPSGLLNFTNMVTGSTYYPNQQEQADKDLSKAHSGVEPGFDGQICYPNSFIPPDMPLEQFDSVDLPISLEGSTHGSSHTVGIFQADRQAHGYQAAQQHSNGPYQRSSYHLPQQPQQQQDQRGNFASFDLRSPTTVGFESAVPTSNFSAPESPNVSSAEADMNLGLLAVSTQLSMQPTAALEGGPYLNLVHQQFSQQHLTLQQQQRRRQQQSLDPSIHQVIRQPFFGVPVGGFMASPLDTLPELGRNVPSQRPTTTQGAGFLSPSSPLGQPQAPQPTLKQEQDLQSWSLDGQTNQDNLSPVLPPSLTTSGATSPLPAGSFGMMLSPTTEAMQNISNRLSAWDGISGPKTDYPNNQQGNGFYANMLSDDGSRPGLYTTGNGANGLTRMDGIEVVTSSPPSHHHHNTVSAVPDAPFGDFVSNPEDSIRAAGLSKAGSMGMTTIITDGGDGTPILHGRIMPIFGGAGRRF